MTTTINNEHEKNQGRKVLNVPNKREQNQTCLDSAEREGLRPKGNVPNLRFPEFQGEWEKHSLGEIGETIIGLTYKPTDVVANDGIIVFRSSNIQNGMIDYSDLVRVNKTIKERIITKKDDILVCARNGSQRLIGKNAIIKEEDSNHTFGAFMMVYRSIDNPFIHPLLSTKRYLSQVSENLGARINQITTSDFNGFEFYFPANHKERRKIAELFRLLDERIATQSKIIDKLQSLIKGLNNKIFATIQGGKYKLGDIATITNGNSNVQDASTKYKEGLYPFFDRSDDTKFLPTFLFNKEAIIYPGEGTEFMPRYYNGKFALHQRCYAIFDFKDFVSPLFMYFLLQTKNAYFIRNAVGSTVPSLRLNTFQNLKVIIPEEKVQRNIYLFLIDFEQKLNIEIKFAKSLLQQKQYLLRQMFI